MKNTIIVSSCAVINKKRSLSHVLHCDESYTTGIWEHEGNLENTRHRRVCSTFLECSQMSEDNVAKNNKHAFSMSYTLIKHGYSFTTNQSASRDLSKYITIVVRQ